VDTVEVSVQPVLLGKGIPLAPDLSTNLTLTNHTIHPTGAISLEYAIPK
jgi:hypothetical protein